MRRERGPGACPAALCDGGFGAVDRLDGGFEVNPGIRQVEPKGGASVDGAGAEDAAQLGEERVEPGIDGGRVGFAPECFSHFVTGNVAVPVDDEVGEQQTPLTSGQEGVEALAVAFDGQLPADLDAQRVRRQGHPNMMAIP